MLLGRLTRFAVFFSVLLVSYTVYVVFTAPEISAVPYDKIFGAHRGDSLDYLENTKEAIIAAAADDNYKFIEFDVQFTRDRQAVVFHDKSLLRMQGKLYFVSSNTYEELLDVSEYHIPLYEEVITEIGTDEKLNVEIKSVGDSELDHELVDYIVNHSIKNGYLENLMISSIEEDVVSYVTDYYPRIETGKVYLLVSPSYIDSDYLAEKLFDNASEIGADYLLLHGVNLRHLETLLSFKPRGKTIGIWYFSNEMYLILKDDADGLW